MPESVASKQRMNRRIHYAWFPLWQYDPDLGRSRITGRAHIDLMKRSSVRCNLHWAVYSKGRFPFFRKKDLEAEGTTRIPLSAVLDLAEEIERSTERVKKNSEHKWKKFRFRSGVRP